LRLWPGRTANVSLLPLRYCEGFDRAVEQTHQTADIPRARDVTPLLFAGRLRAARIRRRWSMFVAGDGRLIGLWLACHFAAKIAFAFPNNKCNCIMTA
jgi:hypothetical protein